jgi:hypothetical protein
MLKPVHEKPVHTRKEKIPKLEPKHNRIFFSGDFFTHKIDNCLFLWIFKL